MRILIILISTLLSLSIQAQQKTITVNFYDSITEEIIEPHSFFVVPANYPTPGKWSSGNVATVESINDAIDIFITYRMGIEYHTIRLTDSPKADSISIEIEEPFAKYSDVIQDTYAKSLRGPVSIIDIDFCATVVITDTGYESYNCTDNSCTQYDNLNNLWFDYYSQYIFDDFEMLTIQNSF